MESGRSRLYKGFFSISLIATIMTIFELLFFIYVVKPNTIHAITELLESQDQKEIDSRLTGIIETFKARENILINDINIGSYIIIIVMVCFMVSLLSYIYMRILVNTNSQVLSPRNFSTGEVLLFNISLKNTIGSSLVVIIILINFQIFFFYFGQKFHYMGKYGTDEVIKLFAETITYGVHKN
jgi:hypothetical protein